MRYFGTDGIRGAYPSAIDERLCYKAGRAVGQYFGGTCLVGRDSRVSGAPLAEAFILGLNRSGAKAFDGGVIPTPAVSYLTRKNGYDCAAVISASHNPPEYNGIKLFYKGGVKLSAEQERAVEFLIDSGYKSRAGSAKSEKTDAKGAYTEFLIKCGKDCKEGGEGCKESCSESYAEDLSGTEVFLDCGFGAVGTIAYDVFSALNAKTASFNDTFEGEKINVECGALYPEFIKQYAAKGLGFSFDGDGDRAACVEGGEVLDGDSVLYTFSRVTPLKDSVVVGTVMANSALDDKLLSQNKRLIRTDVGDKNIAALMLGNGYNLGGEQSGHYIFYPECVSGDGIFAALKLAFAYKKGLVERLNLIKQKTISVPLIEDGDALQALIERYRPKLKRLLVRKSGTEPKLRVMAENDDEDVINEAMNAFLSL